MRDDFIRGASFFWALRLFKGGKKYRSTSGEQYGSSYTYKKKHNEDWNLDSNAESCSKYKFEDVYVSKFLKISIPFH